MAGIADEERWKRFVALTTGQPPWPDLVRAVALFKVPGSALDVGAGAGRDTIHMLARGWNVTALDSSPSAAGALRRIQHPNLRVVIGSVENFVPEDYDLVNAQYSLPFVPRDRFAEVVPRLRDSVRQGGVMSATFFGERDAWNVAGNAITFSTMAAVATLFEAWDVLDLNEVEEDGQTADGSPKHWHVFHLIARRPA